MNLAMPLKGLFGVSASYALKQIGFFWFLLTAFQAEGLQSAELFAEGVVLMFFISRDRFYFEARTKPEPAENAGVRPLFGAGEILYYLCAARMVIYTLMETEPNWRILVIVTLFLTGVILDQLRIRTMNTHTD